MGRPAINRTRLAGFAAGVAGLAVAAGAAALAVSGTDGSVAGNWLGAGHLVLRVNGSTDPVNLSFGQLDPGQGSGVDEFITADMAGVSAAALTLTVTGPGGVAAADQTLQISYTDPQSAAALGWNGGRCAPSGGFANSAATAADIPLGTLTPGAGVCVRFSLALSGSAGNEAQGLASSYAVSYHLQQSASGAVQTDTATNPPGGTP